MNKRLLACILLLAGIYPPPALEAQEHFELSAPGLQLSSRAWLTDSRLHVTSSSGTVSTYYREPRFDSSDGRWLGYYDRSANQVLRWPADGAGPMQIGTPRGNSVEYRMSQMSVRPLATPGEQTSRRPSFRSPTREPSGFRPPAREPSDFRPPAREPSGFSSREADRLDDLRPSGLFQAISQREQENQSAELLRLAAFDQTQSPWLLARESTSGLRAVPPGSQLATDWLIAPAGEGYVRLETYDRGRVYAVSTTARQGLMLQPLAQDARQLWRVRSGHARQRFVLENAFYPGQCLTHFAGGELALRPIAFAPTQLWVPLVAPPIPSFEPFWRSISREVHPNPPLPPARLELFNSHRNALLVLLGDVRRGSQFESMRIEPGGTVPVSLDRDAGATIVEIVEIRSPTGVWDRQELITAVPPMPYYDVSVYEEHLQSIAIDRTGTSPNPIEDINYVPKSVGWFPLPAGDALPPRGMIDVYQRAKEANNPGAVRRLNPEQFDEPPAPDRLESILNEFQTAPRRSF